MKIYRGETEYYNELNSISLFDHLNQEKRIAPKLYKTGKIQLHDTFKNYLIMEMIEGEPLDKWIEKMSSNQIALMVDDIIQILHIEEKIFSVPYLSHNAENLITAAFKRAFNKLSEEDVALLKLTPELKAKCFAMASQATDPERLALVTQDLRARHLIYNQNEFAGLIDLEYAKLNDIALEIGNFLHDLRMLNTDKSRLLFNCLRDKLNEVYAPDVVNRAFLYMIKQGIGNIASKLKRNLDKESILFEMKLIMCYINCSSLNNLDKE